MSFWKDYIVFLPVLQLTYSCIK